MSDRTHFHGTTGVELAELTAVGPYRLIRPIGRGGMSVVYLAERSGSGQRVAVKTVKALNERWIECIRREISSLSRISHPGVVRLIESGTDHGVPWYAMDLLEGDNLRVYRDYIWTTPREQSETTASESQTIPIYGDGRRETSPDSITSSAAHGASLDRRGGRGQGEARPRISRVAAGSLPEVLRLIQRVAMTLAYLHGEGFVNGDLKPDNIIRVGATPILIDFGLAVRHPGVDGRESLDLPSALYGTVPYMSPEQVRGELVDARSDLYSVGCMLYELAVGAPPFRGPARSVLFQHLMSEPIAPSKLVVGVPAQLDAICARLLAKEPSSRYGYGDELADDLGFLGGETTRLSGYPPSSAYLYRPRFVGRPELLAQLERLCRRAESECRGSLVLVGGESGAGKTRIALELAHRVIGRSFRLIKSEASAMSLKGERPPDVSPFHAIQPLLRALADRCHEGGPEATERLIGHRRAVLGLYEPALLRLPAIGSLPPVLPLAPDSARRRLFQYLRDSLSTFAHERPILWVIDDLHWADELSLAFLESLDPEFFAETPLFILCTYRLELEDNLANFIARVGQADTVRLTLLDDRAVRSIVSDMLAVANPPRHFVDFIARHSDGNPFFVAEYLRTCVATRALYRDGPRGWSFRDHALKSEDERTVEDIPPSLRELVEQRLRLLDPAAYEMAVVAAVLGRDMSRTLLGEVAKHPHGAYAPSIDELIRSHVLEERQAGTLRFIHNKLREVALSTATSPKLIEIHARAAEVLESMSESSPSVQRFGTLGAHFAAAKRPERAVDYLVRAGAMARAAFATIEALRLYRLALEQARTVLQSLPAEPERWRSLLMEIGEIYGDLLAMSGRRDEARAAYEDALEFSRPEERADHARVLRKTAQTWETQHAHDEALRCLDRASAVLEGDSVERDQGEPAAGDATAAKRDEWMNIDLGRLGVFYWLNRVAEMEALTAKLRPVVESDGSSTQKAAFFRMQTRRNFRRDRYIISEETVGFARAALAACRDDATLSELPTAHFELGFALLFQRSRHAERELAAAIELAQRAGDSALLARCQAYFAVAARIFGRVDDVKARAETARELALTAGMRDYIALARANQAWVALREDDLDRCAELAHEALEIWGSLSLVFPFQWLARLPLLGVELDRTRGGTPESLARALECAAAMLDRSQQDLPGAVVDALHRAIRLNEHGDREKATRALSSVLESLRGTEYE